MIFTVTPNPVLDRTLTVDAIEFDEMVRARATRLDWGGKGFNVSRALLTMDTASRALGFVGGATGRMLEEGLHDLGVQTDFVHIAGETRTNVVVTEAATGRYIKVNEAGPTITAADRRAFLEKTESLLQPGDWWVLAGSLPPGLEAGFYGELIALIQSAGAYAVLDTSGDALRHGSRAAPYMVKPNALEAGDYAHMRVHSPHDARRAAAFFTREGIKVVAISLGAGGLVVATPTAGVWVKPPAVTIRNPVGAGDALVAGLVWALSHHRDLADCARWAVACGTAAAMREGVTNGTLEEIAAVHDRVEVEAI